MKIEMKANHTIYVAGSSKPVEPGETFRINQDEAARLHTLGAASYMKAEVLELTAQEVFEPEASATADSTVTETGEQETAAETEEAPAVAEIKPAKEAKEPKATKETKTAKKTSTAALVG